MIGAISCRKQGASDHSNYLYSVGYLTHPLPQMVRGPLTVIRSPFEFLVRFALQTCEQRKFSLRCPTNAYDPFWLLDCEKTTLMRFQASMANNDILMNQGSLGLEKEKGETCMHGDV